MAPASTPHGALACVSTPERGEKDRSYERRGGNLRCNGGVTNAHCRSICLADRPGEGTGGPRRGPDNVPALWTSGETRMAGRRRLASRPGEIHGSGPQGGGRGHGEAPRDTRGAGAATPARISPVERWSGDARLTMPVHVADAVGDRPVVALAHRADPEHHEANRDEDGVQASAPGAETRLARWSLVTSDRGNRKWTSTFRASPSSARR